MIVKELIKTAARAGGVLGEEARKETIAFVDSQWNADGSVRGRNGESDLCATAYAAICHKALKGHIPRFRLWGYLHSFGDGSSLDIMHLFCLIRLRSVYPMSRRTRARLTASLDNKTADSATDMFFRVVMSQFLGFNDCPDTPLILRESDSTSDLAAAVVLNLRSDREAERLLMERYDEAGGFHPFADRQGPTLGSTSKALFALQMMGFDLSPVRAACLDFTASLRRADGGYVSHPDDAVPDVENTFYALVCLGCLAEGVSAE